MENARLMLPLIAVAALLAGCSGGTGSQSPTGGISPGPRSTIAGSQAGGRQVTVAMIPKLTGIPYFNACQRGAEEAAKELGVNLKFQGPTQAASDKQIELIDSWIVRKPDVIAVACNNPEELAPALKRASDRGIHVITWDADANPGSSHRELFINQATAESIGTTLVDVMAREAGPSAHTAVITSFLQAPNQSEWLKWMNKRIRDKYPAMVIREVYPSEEKQDLAVARTQDAVKAYPDVTGIWGISSTAFPGAAEAILQAHLGGKITVTGLATPKPMAPYVKAGVVKTVVLWNPVDLGYLAVQTGNALATGTLKVGDRSVNAGRLGKKAIVGDQVILGPPMLFTKANIDRYDF